MITWYAQEQEHSCVAACVRMVLSGFGQHWPEKRIRRLLGNPLFGLRLAEAQQLLAQAGLLVTFHADWDLTDLRDCLRAGHHPIVGLERRFFGHTNASHAIVLLEVGSRFVSAFDPLGGAQTEFFNAQIFEQAWRSAGPDALVIQSPFPT